MESARLLTEDEARGLTGAIQRGLSGVLELREAIAQAYLGEADVALGYESWESYCNAEFAVRGLRPDSQARKGLAHFLNKQGLPQRAIAAATGTSQRTVSNDLREQNCSERSTSKPAGQEVARSVVTESPAEGASQPDMADAPGLSGPNPIISGAPRAAWVKQANASIESLVMHPKLTDKQRRAEIRFLSRMIKALEKDEHW
jgi:hypothetical protein